MPGSRRCQRSPVQPLRRNLSHQLRPEPGAGQVLDRRRQSRRQRCRRPEQDGVALRHPGAEPSSTSKLVNILQSLQCHHNLNILNK